MRFRVSGIVFYRDAEIADVVLRVSAIAFRPQIEMQRFDEIGKAVDDVVVLRVFADRICGEYFAHPIELLAVIDQLAITNVTLLDLRFRQQKLQ
jgi:hypothetical protein